ncbi:MAG: T9SS type A sorting domain-containing protein [Bacteroidota bacterium]
MKIIKLLFIIWFAWVIIPLHSQNWLPLDKGIALADIHHIFPDSNCIYVSGNFTEDGNNIPMRGIAKWDGTKWDSVGDANKFNATKLGIYKYHDTLLTSGIFYDWPYSSFAKLNEGLWEPFPNSRSLDVTCFLEKDNVLYLGGYFNKCGNDSTYLLGKYNGTVFTGMTPLYSAYSPGDVVSCMASFHDTLYVGGLFYLYPQLPIAGFAKWDGFNLLSVSPEFLNSACAVESMVVYQNELYIGGLFWKSNGFTGDCIMKWNGLQFSEVGNTGGANQDITSMKVYNNELYVAGRFTEIGGIVSKNIAKWNGYQWISLNNDDFDNFNSIKDICIYRNELYVAGTFRKIGNDSINSIAKYNHSLVSVCENNSINNSIKIYPNPTTNTLNIDGLTANTLSEIYDISGKLILTRKLISPKMDITGLAKGMYFIKLSTKEGSVVRKFVKE